MLRSPQLTESTMSETEREMLREADEAKLGERRPFESSRQATYEDTFGPASEYERDERDERRGRA